MSKVASIFPEKLDQKMIQKLQYSEDERACEIIDIQFAMSDYQYLEDVVGIKKISQEIEKIDHKLDDSFDDL